MDASEALFGSAAKATRLGEQWLRFFRMPDDRWPTFHANLLAAAAFHDWGKANDGFQFAVNPKGWKRAEQLLRHEHLSALMLALKGVTKWLEGRPDIDADLVLSAVLTHHLKVAG